MSVPETRAPSVQATRIRLETIEAGVARFEGGHHCAVLELSGGEIDPAMRIARRSSWPGSARF